MKWNIYINRRGKTSKHTVEIPNTSRGDNRYATVWASKHFHASQERILAIPTPASESGSRRITRRAGMARRGTTRMEELRAALPAGWTVSTWSPGDGVTRYRFFKNAPANQTYFGPENGRFTALGFKEAMSYVRGLQHSGSYRRRGKRTARNSRGRFTRVR